MKKVILGLTAILAITGCGIDDALKDALKDKANEIKGAVGDKALAAASKAIGQATQNANQAIQAAGGKPGSGIPDVKIEAKKSAASTAPFQTQSAASTGTGFEGPVAGPDGSAGWYKQTYTYAHPGTTDTDSYDIYIRADPAADLSGSWPTIKNLSYSWVGMTGGWAGFSWTSILTIVDEHHVKGSWKYEVKASDDLRSYSKYYLGSHFEGEFDFAGDIESLFGEGNEEYPYDVSHPAGTEPIAVDFGTTMSYSLHFEDRYDDTIYNAPAVAATAVITEWYGSWNININAAGSITYDPAFNKSTGDLSADVYFYFGKGVDPKLTTEPTPFAEGVTPPSAQFVDINDPASKGLYYWSKGEAKATNFTSTETYGASVTSPSTSSITGTCTSKGSSYNAEGEKCSVSETTCDKLFAGLFCHNDNN